MVQNIVLNSSRFVTKCFDAYSFTELISPCFPPFFFFCFFFFLIVLLHCPQNIAEICQLFL